MSGADRKLSNKSLNSIDQVDINEFYSERVNNFEKERLAFDHYLSLIEPKKESTHQLVWYNRKLIEEVRLAQVEKDMIEKKISQTKVDIEQMRKVYQEQLEMKQERLQRITKLKELGRPVESDTTYLVPERFLNFKRHDQKRNAHSSKLGKVRSSHSQFGNFDDDGTNYCKLTKTGEILQLEQRIQDETGRISSYLQDLHNQLKDIEDERYAENMKQKTEIHEVEMRNAFIISEEVEQYEFQCYHSVSELLQLKYRIMIAQRQEVEELEQLAYEKQYFLKKEEILKNELIHEMNHTKEFLRNELQECRRELQTQLTTLNNDIMKLTKQEQILVDKKRNLTEREKKLQSILQDAKDRYSKLKRRNALEMEGYQNEAIQLRKQLKSLMKQMEKKHLIGKDAATASMEQQYHSAQSVTVHDR